MHLRTKQRDTLDTAVRRHLEWLSFNWKTYFSSSSSSTWSESPTWWSSSSWDHRWHEWHSHGWQDKEWRDQQQPRQRQSHAQTSTRRLVRGRQTEKVSVVVKFTWIRTPCVVFAHFYDFSFWQFRVQTVATAMNSTGFVQTTLHRTHTLALFSRCARSHARCDYTFGSRAWRFCFVCHKSHFIFDHVSVECSFDPFPPFFSSLTASLTPLTGIRLNPCAPSARGWTVWRSGRSDPKHMPQNARSAILSSGRPGATEERYTSSFDGFFAECPASQFIWCRSER